MTFHPIPLSPSDTESCLKLVRPAAARALPAGSGRRPVRRGRAQALARRLRHGQRRGHRGRPGNQPVDPADAAKLHDLIYPPGLDAAQVTGIVARSSSRC